MNGAVAIVLAAGEGERLGRGPKAFLEIGGRSILSMAVAAASGCPEVDELVLAVPEGFEDLAGRSIGPSLSASSRVVAGGRTRQESVRLTAQHATTGRALPFTRASAVLPGMVVVDERGEFDSVEHVDETGDFR